MHHLFAQRVEDLRRERDQASEYFKAGKRAYESGEYFLAIKVLEQAVKELGRTTVIGGEAQLWLALAYAVRWRPAPD